MIHCGCCDGEHETVAEIRACCGASEGAGPDGDDAPVPADEFFADDADDPGFDQPVGSLDAVLEPAEGPDATVALLAPVELGRSLVVLPGQDVPDQWSAAPRIALDPTDLAAARRSSTVCTRCGRPGSRTSSRWAPMTRRSPTRPRIVSPGSSTPPSPSPGNGSLTGLVQRHRPP